MCNNLAATAIGEAEIPLPHQAISTSSLAPWTLRIFLRSWCFNRIYWYLHVTLGRNIENIVSNLIRYFIIKLFLINLHDF